MLDDAIGRGRSRPDVQPVEIDRRVVDIGVQLVALLHGAGLIASPIGAGWNGKGRAIIGAPFHQGDLTARRLEGNLHDLVPGRIDPGIGFEQCDGEAHRPGMEPGDQEQIGRRRRAANAIALAAEAILHHPVETPVQLYIGLPVLDLDIPRKQLRHGASLRCVPPHDAPAARPGQSHNIATDFGPKSA